MKKKLIVALFWMMLPPVVKAQVTSNPSTILIDIAHKPKFWNNPVKMGPSDEQLERVYYMTGEITKSAKNAGAKISFLADEITETRLQGIDLLFIHIPSSSYSKEEARVVENFVNEGGSLFVVMDVDYWSTLSQTNINRIIDPFDISFGENSADTLSGGYTVKSPITNDPLKITYHGGRIVNGGTPFCYNNQSTENPFGTYKEVKNGGRIIVMGDGMVSLFMTEWNEVKDYQCQDFMSAAFKWLLKK